eukprot:SAG31_NODE_299_length_18114_cov_3.533777_10_plen_336_part_00
MSNMINWAVGLYPCEFAPGGSAPNRLRCVKILLESLKAGLRSWVTDKDTFLSGHQDWSTSTCMVACPGCLNPPYYGAQEKHPELQALVSALSAGPIAPSDVVGSSNSTLIRSTCTDAGVLLKPDRPAFPPGVMFLRRLRGKGEVQLTHTTLPGAGRWTYCLSFGMSEQITLSGEELGVPAALDESDSFGVAWARTNLQPFGVSPNGKELKRYGPSSSPPLSLAMQPPVPHDWGMYTYWRTASTSCAGKGWTLLGEMKKLISVSTNRVTDIAASCTAGDREPSMDADVVGAEGELVSLSFVRPRPSTSVLTVELKIGSDGTARAHCGSTGKCAQTK